MNQFGMMLFEVTLKLDNIDDTVVYRVYADDEREAAIFAIADPKFVDTDMRVLSVRYMEEKRNG